MYAFYIGYNEPSADITQLRLKLQAGNLILNFSLGSLYVYTVGPYSVHI